MARRVVWTKNAIAERKEILEYWNEHNKSKTYSRKLNQLFKSAINLLQEHHHLGRPTDIKDVRVKIVRNYLLFYEVNDNELIILTIWDSRNDPDKLTVIN